MATNDENNEENFKKLNNDTLSIKERNVAYSELLAVSDYDKNGGRIFSTRDGFVTLQISDSLDSDFDILYEKEHEDNLSSLKDRHEKKQEKYFKSLEKIGTKEQIKEASNLLSSKYKKQRYDKIEYSKNNDKPLSLYDEQKNKSIKAQFSDDKLILASADVNVAVSERKLSSKANESDFNFLKKNHTWELVAESYDDKLRIELERPEIDDALLIPKTADNIDYESNRIKEYLRNLDNKDFIPEPDSKTESFFVPEPGEPGGGSWDEYDIIPDDKPHRYTNDHKLELSNDKIAFAVADVNVADSKIMVSVYGDYNLDNSGEYTGNTDRLERLSLSVDYLEKLSAWRGAVDSNNKLRADLGYPLIDESKQNSFIPRSVDNSEYEKIKTQIDIGNPQKIEIIKDMPLEKKVPFSSENHEFNDSWDAYIKEEGERNRLEMVDDYNRERSSEGHDLVDGYDDMKKQQIKDAAKELNNNPRRQSSPSTEKEGETDNPLMRKVKDLEEKALSGDKKEVKKLAEPTDIQKKHAQLLKESTTKIAKQEAEKEDASQKAQTKNEISKQAYDEKNVVPLDENFKSKYVEDKDGNYRWAFKPDLVAFKETANKLTTRSKSEAVPEDMVKLLHSRGVSEIKVAGKTEFKQMVWAAAQARDIKVKGYEPTEEELKFIEDRHNSIEAANDPTKEIRDKLGAKNRDELAKKDPQLKALISHEKASTKAVEEMKKSYKNVDVAKTVSVIMNSLVKKASQGQEIKEIKVKENETVAER